MTKDIDDLRARFVWTRDMAKVVDDRLGRTTGASKGKAPVSAKPKISKGKVVAPAVAKAFSPEPETESRRMAPSIIKVSGERKF